MWYNILMGVRKIYFANNEVYHVFNRGVDKRNIFTDKYDVARFFESMQVFNSTEPTGGMYLSSLVKNNKLKASASYV